MKYILLSGFVLISSLLNSQTKGVSPIETNQLTTTGNTYAVVVGISDYQDPAIPDLRFADKDAEAFASFLKSKAGGSIPEIQVTTLLNKEATTGKMIAALDGLISVSKHGDEAIIYFSGHGDVERVTKFQRGYWLTYDSPPTVYAAGAFSLVFLQDIITTLSDAGVQVVVVSDACRAGKLAGSEYNGSQATSAELVKQFANEIKILSCQPDEFSLEGEQWGGGRGCFSWFLVDALNGMADANADGTVNLLELGRYLEDKVPAETAPHPQIPMTIGSKSAQIAKLDAVSFAEWKKKRAGGEALFSKIEGRGFETTLLEKADSNLRKMYLDFTAALERGDLITSKDSTQKSADEIYQILIKREELADLHGLMTRNLAAALMDEGQQVINAYLKGDLKAFEALETGEGLSSHRVLADEYHRAAALLGEKHYMYRSLMAKALYFESFAVYRTNIPWDSAHTLDLKYMREAVKWDPSAAYIWVNLAYLSPADSLSPYIEILNELTPKWPIWHYFVGSVYSKKYPEKAVLFYQKAIALDSTLSPPLNAISISLDRLKRYEEAKKYREDAVRVAYSKLAKDSKALSSTEWYNLLNALVNLGRSGEAETACQSMYYAHDTINNLEWSALGIVYFQSGQYAESTRFFLKDLAADSMRLEAWNWLCLAYLVLQWWDNAELAARKTLSFDSTFSAGWNNLGLVFLQTKRFAQAQVALEKAIGINPKSHAQKHLATLALRTGHLKEAREGFLKAIQLDPDYFGGALGMACLATTDGKQNEAFGWLEKAVEAGAEAHDLLNDVDLAQLRALPEWKVLMKKYFPNQFKEK